MGPPFCSVSRVKVEIPVCHFNQRRMRESQTRVLTGNRIVLFISLQDMEKTQKKYESKKSGAPGAQTHTSACHASPTCTDEGPMTNQCSVNEASLQPYQEKALCDRFRKTVETFVEQPQNTPPLICVSSQRFRTRKTEIRRI